jgi:hypothetical protein
LSGAFYRKRPDRQKSNNHKTTNQHKKTIHCQKNGLVAYAKSALAMGLIVSFSVAVTRTSGGGLLMGAGMVLAAGQFVQRLKAEVQSQKAEGGSRKLAVKKYVAGTTGM